jgi:hypothetical protein
MSWSSVGSLGTVDVADAGKVVFLGPVAQLGPSPPGNVESIAAAAPAKAAAAPVPLAALPRITARIRYGVTSSGLHGLGILGLRLYFRVGNGAVLAHLNKVRIPPPLSPPTPVVETVVLQFDSQSLGTVDAPNEFRLVLIPGASGEKYDFANHAYYLTLTLTRAQTAVAPGISPNLPPAVAVVQVT